MCPHCWYSCARQCLFHLCQNQRSMASAQPVIKTCTKSFDKDVWQWFGPRVAAGVIKCANDPIPFSYADLSFKNLDNNSSEVPLASGISVSHQQPGFPDRYALLLPSTNQLTSSTQLVKLIERAIVVLLAFRLVLTPSFAFLTSQCRYRSLFAFHRGSTDALSGAVHVPVVDWHDPDSPPSAIFYCTAVLRWIACGQSVLPGTLLLTQQSQPDYLEYHGERAKVPIKGAYVRVR